ncbi:T9SS type A sorting domain-containing protein [Tamlana sp. 2201CG12-4]|uniref:tetratricopeptide repeat protein n=1 Tax=Tamlana sp. 2201CG12-4 TaxID=3112582 RepID=UPI002DBA4558|nr:T9SS type A sorting domain-containing protein [Tamlana sp. 2201CG12-4]MEC3907480.1 T9SS type A sorting domain-containing protein [Tamlana sp. 2201CG12-4]
MTISAQKKVIDCGVHIREAITYLEGTPEVVRDSLKAINYLKPCVAQANPNAQLLMARLYLHSGKPKHYKKGFQLTKKAAKQNQAVAASDLGDLFKYGIGCKLNYNKAKRWYRKAHRLGDTKGTYSLGYMHYKGLGAVKQNYKRAVKHFKNSTHPMAKHWLGVCYYFGYGAKTDKQKALELLKDNPIENSDVMLDCMTFHLKATQDTKTKSHLDKHKILDAGIAPNQEFSATQLQGSWEGSLMKLDWSGKQVEQTFPLTLRLTYNTDAETTDYTLILNENKYSGTAINNNNTLFFENLKINLKRLYFNAKEEQYIDYNLRSGHFAFKTYNDKPYLTASIETYIESMKEPGNRFALVLTKKVASKTENGNMLSEEAALELAKQSDSFIKLYPNPFQTHLYIAYTLETPGFVQVKVSDLHATGYHVIEQDKMQTPGDYIYYFDGTALKKGIHIITLSVNGSTHTKRIIKK